MIGLSFGETESHYVTQVQSHPAKWYIDLGSHRRHGEQSAWQWRGNYTLPTPRLRGSAGPDLEPALACSGLSVLPVKPTENT
jgi:hypothetical protein